MAHLLLAQCSRLCTSAMLMLLMFSPTSSFSRFSAGKCADILAACITATCLSQQVVTGQLCKSILKNQTGGATWKAITGGKLTCRGEMSAGALVRLCTNSRATLSLHRSSTIPTLCSIAWLIAPSH